MTDLIDRSSPSEDADGDARATAGDASPDVAPGPGETDPVRQEASRSELGGPDRWALGAMLAAAGIIHLVMAPSHLGESAVEGAGFVVAGWVQVGLALALLLRPHRWMLPLSVLANLALVAVWGVSRTTGLPFGDHAN